MAIICKNCNRQNRNAARFCNVCGGSLQDKPSGREYKEKEESTASYKEQLKKMKSDLAKLKNLKKITEKTAATALNQIDTMKKRETELEGELRFLCKNDIHFFEKILSLDLRTGFLSDRCFTALKYLAGTSPDKSEKFDWDILSRIQTQPSPLYDIPVPDEKDEALFAKLRQTVKFLEMSDINNAVLNIKETFALSWNNKGLELVKDGEPEKAITCFDNAITINLKDFSAWNNKGLALNNLKRYGDAIGCFDKAIEINPRDFTAWYKKGSALDKQERYREAIDCYNKTLDINPDHEPAKNNKLTLTKLAIKLNKDGLKLYEDGKPDEAIVCFNKALEINSTDSNIWNNKGLALDKQTKYRDAVF